MFYSFSYCILHVTDLMPKQFFILFLEFFKQIKKKPLEENPIAKYWEINVFKNSSLKSVFFF